MADFKQIEILRVKRYAFVQPREIILSISLHGFCDSSSQVHCGMVCIRVETTLGIIAKIAPLKEFFIPRLELLGCVLLRRF